MVAKAMISLEGFSFRYAGADRDAASNIDLSVRRGECLVITGRSGCGKTTVMRAMNGLIPLVYPGKYEGTIAIDGIPLYDWTTDELVAKVGSVFQNPRSQFINDEVASEIAFGCENQGLPREEIEQRVQESAREMGVSHLLSSKVDELSGGQSQMVILSSIHATHPDVYLLDEPTASLDVESMRRLGRAVSHLKALGKTIVVSEHRLWWIADTADRVIVIEDGRMKGTWTAEEFSQLSPELRRSWGLRAWSIGEIDCKARRRFSSNEERRSPDHHPLMLIKNLSVRYRHGHDVLNGLDLDVSKGTAVGIVGANGAGKTTLARCLCGLQKECAGSVELSGCELKYRKRPGVIYLVMQNPGYQLFESSVRAELDEAIVRGGRNDSDGREEVAAMMRSLDLSDLSERHPLSLSGGQRQRTAIAAGLLFGAQALVMDEPTSGLDHRGMQAIVSQIHHLKSAGMGIVVITHDYEFLCAACDVVAHVDDGRVKRVIHLASESLDQVKSLVGFDDLP